MSLASIGYGGFRRMNGHLKDMNQRHKKGYKNEYIETTRVHIA